MAPTPHPPIPNTFAHGRAQTQAAQREHLRRLIDLLQDDSAVVQRQVRDELKRLDRSALPALHRAAQCGPARQSARARQFLLRRSRSLQVRRLLRYAARGHHDLETALFLLEGHATPQADTRPHRKLLDLFGTELANRVAQLPAGSKRVAALVQYLSAEIGFAGSERDFHHPSNIYLSGALNCRQGMPLTLCAIYSAVARRAGMRSGLLPLPGHVLLSITEGGRRYIVDPFHGGKLLSKAHCAGYLAAHELPYSDEYMREASDTDMFRRHIHNLMSSLRERRRLSEYRELALVAQVLDR